MLKQYTTFEFNHKDFIYINDCYEESCAKIKMGEKDSERECETESLIEGEL